jgi:hypothetical protein
MNRLDYQKPEITIIHAEPERMLAASGRAAKHVRLWEYE